MSDAREKCAVFGGWDLIRDLRRVNTLPFMLRVGFWTLLALPLLLLVWLIDAGSLSLAWFSGRLTSEPQQASDFTWLSGLTVPIALLIFAIMALIQDIKDRSLLGSLGWAIKGPVLVAFVSWALYLLTKFCLVAYIWLSPRYAVDEFWSTMKVVANLAPSGLGIMLSIFMLSIITTLHKGVVDSVAPGSKLKEVRL